MPDERSVVVLIVGADGALGRAVASAWRAAGARVIETTRRPAPGDRLVLDLAQPVASVPLPRVDVAYLMAAATEIAACERDPEGTRRVNETHPIELARRLVAQGAHVVFPSTNLVFDGRVPHQAADDPPRPPVEYGRQKARVEAAFATLGDGAAVLRLTKIVTPTTGPFAAWAQALRRGERVEAFSDKVFAPVSLAQVVPVFHAIGARRLAGMFQTSSTADMTYADAAALIARRVGAPADHVRAVLGRDRGQKDASLPPHTTLDARRVQEVLGWTPPDPADALCEGLGL